MKKIMMSKITDKDIGEIINGVASNELIRSGLCGQDISHIDLSELSIDSFKKISFDEKTIFSKEQLKKFKPFELLEKSKKASNYIEQLHNNGVDGKGQNIAVIDTNIDAENEMFENANLTIINDEKSGEKEEHGATVLSALLQVVPNANIKYFADNKYDENRDFNVLEYIKRIVEDGNIKIISMSSRIRNEKVKEDVQALLEENGITLIDSETFYKKFTYCFRNFDTDGNEKFEEAFCEKEEIYASQRQSFLDQVNFALDNYSIDSSNMEMALKQLKANLIRDGRQKDVAILEEKEQLLLNDNIYGKEGYNYIQKQRNIKREQEEREKNGSIEVPCAGRTFIARDGKYKYFGTCSASYTIPQVAGYFALARQIQKDLNFEDFIKICEETSQNIGNRKIANPLKMVELLKERNIESGFINELKSKVNNISENVKETDEEINQRITKNIYKSEESKSI